MNIKEFLLKAKEIMDGEDFDELRKRDKKKIFDLFFEIDAKKEFDGDSDGTMCFADVISCDDAWMRILFCAYTDDSDDMEDHLDDMQIQARIDGDCDIISIDQAIDYIDKYSQEMGKMFTRKELEILSDCVISKIGEMGNAQKLFADFPEAQSEIQKSKGVLQEINKKICGMMETATEI